MLYKSREAVIKLFNDYSSIVSDAKYKKGIPSMSARVARGKVFNNSNLKILRSKQILQILPNTLAQLKAGNTSGNLLKEIRQIIYSLYRAKEVIKKVYSNIINAIKL